MVFLTGATGYVGRYVLYGLIKNGERVKALARKREDAERFSVRYPKAKFVIGDLSDRGFLVHVLKGEKLVIHLAAVIHGSEKEMKAANVEGVRNLVHACKKNRIKKIVFLSSMSVRRPYLDDYAKTKLEGERIILDSGLDCIILRPTMIFGGEGGSFSGIVRTLNSVPFFIPVFGSGRYTLAPVHAEDVARAVVIAAGKGRIKGIYEIGGERISFNEFVEVVKLKYGIHKVVIHIPIFAARIAAFFLSLLGSQKLTGAMIMNTITSSDVNTERFIKDFGFKPRSFKEGF